MGSFNYLEELPPEVLWTYIPEHVVTKGTPVVELLSSKIRITTFVFSLKITSVEDQSVAAENINQLLERYQLSRHAPLLQISFWLANDAVTQLRLLAPVNQIAKISAEEIPIGENHLLHDTLLAAKATTKLYQNEIRAEGVDTFTTTCLVANQVDQGSKYGALEVATFLRRTEFLSHEYAFCLHEFNPIVQDMGIASESIYPIIQDKLDLSHLIEIFYRKYYF